MKTFIITYNIKLVKSKSYFDLREHDVIIMADTKELAEMRVIDSDSDYNATLHIEEVRSDLIYLIR